MLTALLALARLRRTKTTALQVLQTQGLATRPAARKRSRTPTSGLLLHPGLTSPELHLGRRRKKLIFLLQRRPPRSEQQTWPAMGTLPRMPALAEFPRHLQPQQLAGISVRGMGVPGCGWSDFCYKSLPQSWELPGRHAPVSVPRRPCRKKNEVSGVSALETSPGWTPPASIQMPAAWHLLRGRREMSDHVRRQLLAEGDARSMLSLTPSMLRGAELSSQRSVENPYPVIQPPGTQEPPRPVVLTLH